MDLMSQETWKFINTFAPWLAAIGTLMAVGVSLYLARQDKRVRLNITAGYRVIVSQGMQGKPPGVMAIRVVNVGHREAQITGIGWKVGLIIKQHAEQMTIQGDGISSPLPTRLRDGDEAVYYFPMDGKQKWLEGFVAKLLLPHHKWKLRNTKVGIFTSVGKTFEARIEKGLMCALLKYIETTKNVGLKK